MADTGGINPVGDAAKQVDTVATLFHGVSTGVAADVKKMTEVLTKNSTATRTSTSEMAQLAKLLPELKKNQDLYGSSVKYVTQTLINEHKLLGDTGEKEYAARRTQSKEIIALIQEQGSQDMESRVSLAAHSAEIRKLNFEEAQERLHTMSAIGRSSHGVTGALKGVIAKVEEHGLAAGRAVGEFTGASAGAIVGVTVVAAGLVGVFLALKWVIEGIAGASKNAALAGHELQGDYASAGLRYMDVLSRSRGVGPGGMLSGISTEALNANISGNVKNFIYDVGLTAKAYRENLPEAMVASREANRNAIAGFVADTMYLGTTYGLEGAEATKLATKMGTLGRGTIAAGDMIRDPLTTVAAYFGHLAAAGQRLNVPLEDMIGTMGGLADLTYSVGLSTPALTRMTENLYDAMGKTDNFAGFDKNRAEDVSHNVAELMKALQGVSTTRIMALNQRPGGTFDQSLDAAYKDRLGGISKSLENAVRDMGLRSDYLRKDVSTSGGDYRLAAAMGLSGDIAEMVRQGHELAQAKRSGAFTDHTISDINANRIDKSYDTAKSVGQNIAMGADVMQLIAGTLQNILRIIAEVANEWVFHSKTAAQYEATQGATQAMAVSASAGRRGMAGLSPRAA